MITLAIETSSKLGGIALVENGITVFNETFTADRGHSAQLFSSLERALKRVERCDQIAVGLGPGSYSGVRIAISTAIGLEFGLGGRLIGIPSLAAMQTTFPSYIAIGDARRDTFYFAKVIDGECADGPSLLTAPALKESLSVNTALPVFTSELIAAFPQAEIAYPSAEILARLAERGCGIYATENLQPIYLREPHITRPKQRNAPA